MVFTHRSIAKLSRYLLLSLLSSSLVQLTAMWRPVMWCLVAIGCVGLLILLMLGVQYYGLFTGRTWAKDFEIHRLNQGLIQFIVVLLFAVIGGVPTWYAFFS